MADEEIDRAALARMFPEWDIPNEELEAWIEFERLRCRVGSRVHVHVERFPCGSWFQQLNGGERIASSVAGEIEGRELPE